MAKTHVVRRGETLAQIALDYGFTVLDPIKQEAGNAELLKKRPDANVLYPGDKITIPDPRRKEMACDTARRHTFRMKPLMADFRVVLRDHEHEPLPHTRYRLRYDGKTEEGTSSAKGVVEKKIPARTKEVELTAWIKEDGQEEETTWLVNLAGFDSIDDLWGVQARLNNLGFECGEPDGEMNEKTREAIAAFQEFLGMEEPTGELTDEVRKALARDHDA